MECARLGLARLIIEWCTKLISSGDSESPVTDTEVDQDAEAFDNCRHTNPNHDQGRLCFKLVRWQWEGLDDPCLFDFC